MAGSEPNAGNGFTARLTCLTYNIHSGIGLDQRYDLQRIRRILAEAGADVICLQELNCGQWRTAHEDQVSSLAQGLEVNSSFCAVRPEQQGSFGMAVLSRFPVLLRQQYDLSYRPTSEPRYCQRVDLAVEPGRVLHIFNCHLGLAVRERQFQRNRMLSDAILLSEDLHHPVILMGDFNDSPISVVHRRLRAHFADAFTATGKRWGPTFKAGPLPLRLDHIYCSRNVRVMDCWVRNDELTRVASDHRPVVASLEVTWS